MDKYIEMTIATMKDIFPDDCEVTYQQVKKNNGVLLDGIVVRTKEKNIAPTYYVSAKEKKDFTPEQLAKQFRDHYLKEKEEGIDFDVAEFGNLNWAKERMLFDIVNRKRNEGSELASIPVTEDLMITFKVSVMPNANIRVTNNHLHLWGDISPQDLLEPAINNAVITDKATFRSISEVLVDMMVSDYKYQYPDVPEDVFRERIKKEMFGGLDGRMFVLTTQRKSSAALLYPEMLESIRKQLDSDLVILPSSIYEVLVMRKEDAISIGLENVKAMVREVNRDIVMQENATDFLSDEILIYDGELKQLDDHNQAIDEMAI